MTVRKLIQSTLTQRTAALWLLLVIPPVASGQQYTIKFATIAPEGSSWMNVMHEYDSAVRAESGGRIGFKIYAGGVQGDEIDALRKIKLGQLQSAGVTGNGLTTIAPEVRVLDSPFLFDSYAEVDTVYKVFNDEFSKAFESNGFVNLGWAEVGFVYVFTKTPVRSPDDMKDVKMWMWEGDPIAEAAFRAMGIHPIPLTFNDVLQSLQTGLIDGVYSTPYAIIALQWFSRLKYMMDVPLADAAGAVVIYKKFFDKLPADLQDILLRNGHLYMSKLTATSREDNRKALQTLRSKGISILQPSSPNTMAVYGEIGKKARRYLAGKLYSQDLLTRVENVVEEKRTNERGQSK